MRRPKRDRIGADAEEASMAQADLAGKTHQQIEAEHRERVDEDQGDDAIVEVRRQDERQEHDDQPDRNDQRIGAESV
jgi:hypothetical protein